MANTSIPMLGAVTALSGGELLELVQPGNSTGTSKRVTAQQLSRVGNLTPGTFTFATVVVNSMGIIVSISQGILPGVVGYSEQATALDPLFAGALVSFTTGGVILADATDTSKPAMGFVMEAYSIGQTAVVYFQGALNSALSGLTPGGIYFLSTDGEITAGVPVGPTQFVGYATAAGHLLFNQGPMIL